MMERLRELIWYTVLLVVVLVAYHLGTSYTVALVAGGYRSMQPTLDSGEVCFLDRRRATVTSLEKDDVIAYRIVRAEKFEQTFGRVIAAPGATVSVRDDRLLVDGADVARAPKRLPVLSTGLIVPRATVFIVLDSAGAGGLPLADRLVPYRDILGRVMGK